MKSNTNKLANRGYLEEGEENNYNIASLQDKLDLLYSKIAKERTLGARLLINENSSVAHHLIRALAKENKLYTKIEICKALDCHEKDAIPLLIQELGKIGINQHKEVPEKDFCKDNYPLPRDIAARTLAHIGINALPQLLQILHTYNIDQLSEAIDAIGFICFYNKQTQVFEQLKECYAKHRRNDLICWKIIRAMSGFSESLSFLSEEITSVNNERIVKELQRSIRLIKKSMITTLIN